PLQDNLHLKWETSWVRHKLNRVLWVPVEGEKAIPFAQRRIGMAILWSPSPAQETLLRQDWEELMDMICLGRQDEISAHHGQVLQIRPKAAHSRILSQSNGADGAPAQTLPRGFYLRAQFTRDILQQRYAL
ncbi:MAG: DNA mismatch repair protein MutH, partial [Gammaproteobacteria bacterium]|nr:DNA mismatch repair protein MutH [Gammaproteobacteria bacterium]